MATVRTGRFIVDAGDRHAGVVVIDPSAPTCPCCGRHPSIEAKLTEWLELLALLQRMKREHLH